MICICLTHKTGKLYYLDRWRTEFHQHVSVYLILLWVAVGLPSYCEIIHMLKGVFLAQKINLI